MNTKQKQRTGFTIVELAIVIVVIGILAAIVVVAYSGMQRRADNAKVLASVDSWQKTIQLYQINNTMKLPDDWTCLGMSVEDFPLDSAFNLGPGMCERGMIVNDTWTSEYKIVPPQPFKPTPTPVLLRQETSPGSGATKTLSSGTKVIKGVIYAAVSNQTQVDYPGAYLFYALDQQACPTGEDHSIHGNVNICARLLTKPGLAWIDAIDV